MENRYRYYNPNPKGKKTTDCVIRMLTKIFGLTWREAYLSLSEIVLEEYEMPSSNNIWERYLKYNGFRKRLLPNTCPDCYTLNDFVYDHPIGTYVACTNTHVIAVENGCFFDAWDSGDEVITYFFERR